MAEPQSIWGWAISLEGFLSATAAGVYTAGTVAISASTGIGAAPLVFFLSAILAIGSLLVLLADLGRKERALNVFANPRSPMAVGAVLLSLFTLISLVSLVLGLFFSPAEPFFIPVLAVGEIFAISVLVYPSVLFRVLRNIPLWRSLALPVLFVFSGLASGSAVVELVAGGSATFVDLRVLASSSLGLYGLTFLLYLLDTRASGQLACKESINLIVRGRLAIHFWAGVVTVGLAVPSALNALALFSPNDLAIPLSSICTIIGIFFMRHVILAAGVPMPLRLMSAWFYPRMKA